MENSSLSHDVLVIGAGLWGCVVARELAEAGNRVLVLEARTLPGGNARSAIDPKTGIECHCYGAHIFHTSDEEVWTYANRFATFTDYRHTVLTEHAGKVYFMPLGLALINAFYGKNLRPDEVPAFIASEIAKSGLSGEPKNLEEQAISLIGRPLYEAFIKGYTQKQWKDYLAIRDAFPAELPVFYSGPIDAYFDFRHGALPWRGLRFEWEVKPVRDWQGTTVMNYADLDVPYTRIHEFKHFHPERKEVYASEQTIICREYPADWKVGDIPYYPVNTDASAALLARYQEEAKALPNVIFGGRLGEYKYYDMDKVIRRALDQVHDWMAR